MALPGVSRYYYILSIARSLFTKLKNESNNPSVLS